MTIGVNLAKWDAGLDASRERTLKTVAGATSSSPTPRGPAWSPPGRWFPHRGIPSPTWRHAHARARQHLVRLTAHDPGREVTSAMTNELFDRLTDGQPAPLTAPAGAGRYTYTPRKVLRRVLDHALDHLNQIDQWLAWRRDGLVPTPTDGWVPSTVTLPDDRLPLAPADLDAWLWRIDQAARLLAQRAAGLTPKSSTGRRPTAAGPFAGSFTTWRAPRSSIRRRWTRRCRRRIRRRDTRKRAAGSARPSARRAIDRWTRRSSIQASMVSSAHPTR